MIFANLFKKRAWAYYLIQACVLALNVVFPALMPKAYINWVKVEVALYMVFAGLSYGMLGFMLADAKGAKARVCIVQSVLFTLLCGVPFLYLHGILTLGFGVDLRVVLTLTQVLLFVTVAICHLLLAVRTIGLFEVKGRGKELVIGITAAALLIACVTPFTLSFFKRYVRPYSFLSEPVVFVNAEGYSVVFATSALGTGEVVVVKDGVETTYCEEKQGIQYFHSQIHRVDVPEEALSSGEYYVRSTQVLSGSGDVLRTGKTITGDKKRLQVYSGTGDLSFLTISDNQGAEKPTVRAVKNAAGKYDYDFVFMLGDHSETYNDYEEDIIKSLLRPAAYASGGELPVYFTLGNHEYRGDIAPCLWDLIPTPSVSGEFYYTFHMGDAFFTVLNYGSDHDDDYTAKYGGLVNHNAYRDKEYDWLSQTMATAPYLGYRYNVCISHIPLLYQKGEGVEYAYEHVCTECNKVHAYKYKEFSDLLIANGVQYVISGHTHKAPALLQKEGCPYVNLNTGSHYKDHARFRNVLVRLKNGTLSYEVYEG